MKVGAIARASMPLYGGPGMKPEAEVAETAPPAEETTIRVGGLVLVPFGAHGDQIAQVVERHGEDAVSVRKWSGAGERFTAPVRLPVRRLLGRPAEDDARLEAVRAAIREERQPRRASKKRSPKKR